MAGIPEIESIEGGPEATGWGRVLFWIFYICSGLEHRLETHPGSHGAYDLKCETQFKPHVQINELSAKQKKWQIWSRLIHGVDQLSQSPSPSLEISTFQALVEKKKKERKEPMKETKGKNKNKKEEQLEKNQGSECHGCQWSRRTREDLGRPLK